MVNVNDEMPGGKRGEPLASVIEVPADFPEAVPHEPLPGNDAQLNAGAKDARRQSCDEATNIDLPGGKLPSPREASYQRNVRYVGIGSLAFLTVGLVLAALGAWPNAVAALLWSVTCSAIGWVLGFIFGIPRTLSTEGQSEAPQTGAQAAAANAIRNGTARRTTGTNTNLEQISDWLTKILVGVTLVQLPSMTDRLHSAAVLIAASLGDSKMESFAYALMLYFALTGFLASYLLTRLFLQRAFEEDIQGRNWIV